VQVCADVYERPQGTLFAPPAVKTPDEAPAWNSLITCRKSQLAQIAYAMLRSACPAPEQGVPRRTAPSAAPGRSPTQLLLPGKRKDSSRVMRPGLLLERVSSGVWVAGR
jgi:hypothetical protein